MLFKTVKIEQKGKKMFDDDYSGFDEFGMMLGEAERDFLEKAKKLLASTTDPWLTNFTKSLVDQVTRGRTLSEKQLTVFYKNFNNPPKAIEPGTHIPNKAETIESAERKLKGLLPSESWYKTFLESIIKQIKAGKTLSQKQKEVFYNIPTREPSHSENAQAEPKSQAKPTSQTQQIQSQEIRAACVPVFVPSKPIIIKGVPIQKEGPCRACKAQKLLHFSDDICQDCDPLPF